MDKAARRYFYHLGSALGARDSRNRVSWLSTHLLDSLLTRRLYRKELGCNPFSTLSLVRKWGPSTRNIIRSIRRAATGRYDPIDENVQRAAARISQHSSTIFDESMPRSEGSSIIFLRRAPDSISVGLERGMAFIPTPHLMNIFELHRQNISNQASIELFVH